MPRASTAVTHERSRPRGHRPPGAQVDAVAERQVVGDAGHRASSTVEKTDAGAWKALAVGAGALVLVLCAAELVTLGRLRSVRAT